MTSTLRPPRRRPRPRRLLLPAAASAVLLLTGCGLVGPAEYDTETRTIEAEAGEEFSITVPYSPGQGEWWYRVDPRPDDAVVRIGGEHQDLDGSDLDGGTDGTKSFDFEAVGPGTTKIRILHCPVGTCVGSGSSVSPSPAASPGQTTTDPQPRYYTYTVTVR
ncbi:protease inhibitor I42 family protein [Streptomyces sp. AS02]|uniref:protease inhibitor I42 family protein n=1 Tax=Streptomyces sp. AS02 TaxID=2938946 RepID=UPI002021FB43|nr:protease inhibitor I42 family protein [Streptomyces sp. AS02]MCL8014603.1 protease inhibitor I42 family protein [Streptomyces sp. AS02]